jgi:hypothetical protein
MTIKRMASAGLGLGNQTFPIWGLGATMYWTSANGTQVQTPGGTGTVNIDYLDSTGTTATAPYYVYDIYKGHFKQVDPTTAVEVDPSGFVGPDRDNFFNDTQTSDRGFTTVDGGLITSTPALSSDHILDLASTGLTNGFRVANTSGGPLRFSRSETISSSFRRNFSVLVKRDDGGIINGTVLTLFIAATSGGANEGTGTDYKKIREDGWYEVMMSISPDASTSKFLGVILEDGFTIDVEAPGQESSGVLGTSSISAGTNPPPHLGSTPGGGTVVVDFASGVGTGSEEEPFPEAGWIGCTVVHPYSMTQLQSIGVPSPNDEIPAGTLVNWEVSTSERIRFLISRTVQSVAAELDSAGSDFFLQEGPDVLVGDTNGMVVSWGRRGSTNIAYLYINGEQIEINTGTYNGPPVGTPSSIQVGFRLNAGVPSTTATSWVQHIAIGRNLLTRTECRHLSRWFEQQALNKFNV